MKRLDPAVALGGALAFLAPLLVYLQTMSRTLNFWDCGEFITTSYILGIPHPPATPMFVLVGRLASLLPFGDGVAHRLNMMSGLFGALATWMMYMLIMKVTRQWFGPQSEHGIHKFLRIAGALSASFLIAFSDTFWINAIEAEVYALSAFLMGLVTWLILDWREKVNRPEGNALVYLIVYLLALGVGFHLGTILIFPGFFVMALMIREKAFSDRELWALGLALAFFLGSAIMHWPDLWMSLGMLAVLAWAIWLYSQGKRFALYAIGLFALGLSVHLFLLIRAGQHPAINEADPSNWANLWAVIKREQYPARSIFVRESSWGFQLHYFWHYLWNQFRMPFQGRFLGLNPGAALTALPLGLAVIGLWQQFRRQRKVFVALLIVLLVNTLGLVVFLNFTADEVRDRDYFYAPGFYFIALFIGLGAVGLLEGFLQEKKGKRLAGSVAAILLILSVGPAFEHWYTHDRSEIHIARDYAWNMLAPLDENAVIFTNGDNDTFPLWYIQEVEHFRRDVRVVNLSLLNTAWYMEQLRDQEPKLPITMTDAELAEVAHMYFQGEDGRIYQPRDKIIDHLFGNTLKEGWDSRSYYFAVTVPRDFLSPLLPYLKMEGMVYRMTLDKGEEQVDMGRLRENLEEVFIWRGLQPDWNDNDSLRGRIAESGPADSLGGAESYLPPSRRLGEFQGLKGELPEFPRREPDPFYMNPTIRHLIQNYAAAWSRYAIELDRGVETEKDPGKAVEAMTRAWTIDQDFSPVVNYLGYLYASEGEEDKGMEAYDYFAETLNPRDFRFWARYAQALEKAERHEDVIRALGKVIELNPDYEPGYLSLVDYVVSYFPSRDNIRAVVRQLEEFMSRHPDSSPVGERLDLLRKMVDKPGPSNPNP